MPYVVFVDFSATSLINVLCGCCRFLCKVSNQRFMWLLSRFLCNLLKPHPPTDMFARLNFYLFFLPQSVVL